MVFIPLPLYEYDTLYTDVVPEHLLYLILPGFKPQFVKGPWGYYLSQCFETDEYVFWIHYIKIDIKCSLFPVTTVAIYTLHHLLKGSVYSEINNGVPVQLSDLYSQFLAIPGKIKQEAFFNTGVYKSCHIDYAPAFLEKYADLCGDLMRVLEQFKLEPALAVATPPVHHGSLVSRIWNQVVRELAHESSPQIYLDAKVRELLRLHCKSLQQKSAAGIAINEGLTLAECKAAERVKQIIEADVSKHYSIKQLSAKVNMNVVTLKKAFKKVYTTTILQHLINCRMIIAIIILNP